MSMRGLNRLSLPLSTLNDNPSFTSSASSSTKPSLTSYFTESNIHPDIKITFILPDGGKLEEVVSYGDNVQEIKRRLYSASKIPSNSLFFFNGQCMLDPLSLNDIPGVAGNSTLLVEVKVKGQTTSDDSNKQTSGGANDITTNTTPKTTDNSHEQQKEKDRTNTTIQNNRTITTIPEENAEQMYTTGNGKDERRDSLPRGRDEPERTPIDEKDTIHHDAHISNFVEPAATSSSPDTLSTLPSLPGHSAFDDDDDDDDDQAAVPNNTNTNNTNKPGPENSTKSGKGETTIDVGDDESPQGGQKQIQTLGGGKQRWFCQVV